MKTLNHGDFVRLPVWNHLTFVSVGTVRGYLGEDSTDTDPPWVTYTGAVLTDSSAFYAEKAAKAAKAIVIEDGEVVEIENARYRVQVMRGCQMRPVYCDPIHFEPVEKA